MRLRRIVPAAAAALAALAAASRAEAQLIIKQPDNHPDYRAELEPHGNLVLFHGSVLSRRGFPRGYGVGVGAGFRATIEVADPVIPTINNTIGVTFGADFTSHAGTLRIWNPIGVQWNFFLTERWSVFGDFGFLLRSDRDFYGDVHADLFFMAGGRLHLSERVALTMRIGYPFVSFGGSFFVG